jgi:hypothetical protein
VAVVLITAAAAVQVDIGLTRLLELRLVQIILQQLAAVAVVHLAQKALTQFSHLLHLQAVVMDQAAVQILVALAVARILQTYFLMAVLVILAAIVL